MLRHGLHSINSVQLGTGLLIGFFGTTYTTSATRRAPRFQSSRKSVNENLETNISSAVPSVKIITAPQPEDVFAQLKRAKSVEYYQPSVSNYARAFARLLTYEQSSSVPFHAGISRYDVSQITSNDPTEDDHAEHIAPLPNGSYWSFFGVYDGHNGWETSAWLRENLLSAVTGALADLYSRFGAEQPSSPEPSRTDIETTIKETFKRVDDDIVYSALERAASSTSKYEAINILAPAHAGSCALLSFYDSHSRLLHVAVTGDSRAILGRRVQNESGTGVVYEVHELSVDQNGRNTAEESRLQAQHPGEAIVKDGRVLGWGIARAFGDARMKWSLDVQRSLKTTLLGRSISSTVKTPPYFTAEPEVTSTEIQQGDFLIMASDGLWDTLTNEEAVGLVGWWLDKPASSESEKPAVRVVDPPELPVAWPEDYTDDTGRYKQWNSEKKFISTDANVATHLIRNAVGGADEDLLAALMSMRSPRSRNYFDDITVTVVFFE